MQRQRRRRGTGRHARAEVHHGGDAADAAGKTWCGRAAARRPAAVLSRQGERAAGAAHDGRGAARHLVRRRRRAAGRASGARIGTGAGRSGAPAQTPREIPPRRNAMNFASAWLLTVVLHGALLLTFAFVVDRAVPRLLPAARELLWRGALFGALLTATLQIAVQHAPLGGRVMFAAPSMETATAVANATSQASTDTATNANAAPTPAAPAPKPAATAAEPAPLSALLTRALVAQQPGDTPAPRAPFPWTLALWLIWAIGAQFGVFRFALAWTRWQRRVRAA